MQKYATLWSIKLRIKYTNLKISHKISWEMDSKLNQLPTSFCLTIGPESLQCYSLHMLLPCHSVFCSIWIEDTCIRTIKFYYMRTGETGLTILFYHFTFLNLTSPVTCEAIIKYTVYLSLNSVLNRAEIKSN